MNTLFFASSIFFSYQPYNGTTLLTTVKKVKIWFFLMLNHEWAEQILNRGRERLKKDKFPKSSAILPLGGKTPNTGTVVSLDEATKVK